MFLYRLICLFILICIITVDISTSEEISDGVEDKNNNPAIPREPSKITNGEEKTKEKSKLQVVEITEPLHACTSRDIWISGSTPCF
ncbi:hypothetical protein HCN44_007678 [Aphidius gifuensis]|uniref:Insecticidal toxin Vn1 n=1 Tax=Aphidius gifuensis TaxID=684658 RepID=TXVN1_APHGI|nr:hypothetical protein HCN44_007678 [Aphidius gifuensis]